MESSIRRVTGGNLQNPADGIAGKVVAVLSRLDCGRMGHLRKVQDK